MVLKSNPLTLTAVGLEQLLSPLCWVGQRSTLSKPAKLASISKHTEGKLRKFASLGACPATCGSYALKRGEAKVDAHIIGTLNDAGLIIIAMANLSLSSELYYLFLDYLVIFCSPIIFSKIFYHFLELGNSKGDRLMAGWSAVGGQTKNPHVEGDIPLDAPPLTSWGPAGSSSGSATAVTAGFSPVSLGTELEGSITWPAARVGLYAIKLTPGSTDLHGFQPGAERFLSQGPYGKTTADVALLSAIIQRLRPNHCLPLTTSWHGLKLGFVEPSLWRVPNDTVKELLDFKLTSPGDNNQRGLEKMRDSTMTKEQYDSNVTALQGAARCGGPYAHYLQNDFYL
ncbi:hypothetical protein O1611_g4703 [Lasiodiplodia mahajangana]|uniref:Uncharacterized protein n=1 Tax=Lasiodiplodia mahajangana TaxID=1108764 RepID=A0ACC2JN97_9PEZI|nr:hypothetical protein O1611_g4703 [Lasiodiplodia mahajangana]